MCKTQYSNKATIRLEELPRVLVVNIVGVLPHVHGEHRLLALRHGVARADRLVHHLIKTQRIISAYSGGMSVGASTQFHKDPA